MKIKRIRVKEFDTFWSIRIWDRETQDRPRVRTAGIDAKGRAPHLDRILAEEKSPWAGDFDRVEVVWQ